MVCNFTYRVQYTLRKMERPFFVSCRIYIPEEFRRILYLYIEPPSLIFGMLLKFRYIRNESPLITLVPGFPVA